MAGHNDFGKEGEDLASEFLKKSGHIIIARNYRHGKAEIDIISKDGKTHVFTEVKSRSSDNFGYPEEFVSTKKKQLMSEAAEEFMHANQIDSDIRFDVIAITKTKENQTIEHIKDAFHSDDMIDSYS